MNAVETLPFLTFNEVVCSLSQHKADAAIMALENSIAGSIIPNYALIDTNELYITGEYYLDVQHNLMALSGQNIMEIKIHSHPMALLQCKVFFDQYPHIKLVEDSDTAEVARRVHDQQLLGIAAIASEAAAEIYKLKILAKSIQTIKQNETRFVIVERHQNLSATINKASLKFMLDHKRGSLATIQM